MRDWKGQSLTGRADLTAFMYVFSSAHSSLLKGHTGLDSTVPRRQRRFQEPAAIVLSELLLVPPRTEKAEMRVKCSTMFPGATSFPCRTQDGAPTPDSINQDIDLRCGSRVPVNSGRANRLAVLYHGEIK